MYIYHWRPGKRKVLVSLSCQIPYRKKGSTCCCKLLLPFFFFKNKKDTYIIRIIVIENKLLWTWKTPTVNLESSGICLSSSSVIKWQPRWTGRRLTLRWNQTEPVLTIPSELLAVAMFVYVLCYKWTEIHWQLLRHSWQITDAVIEK